MPDDIGTYGDDAVRRAWIGVGVPILGLIFIVIMLAVATLAGFAREQDDAYAESTRRLAAGAFDGRAQALASVTLDYSNWNEALQAITVNWDQDWVENNIYSSVADGMVLFRGNGSVRFAWFSEPFAEGSASVQHAAVAAARGAPGLRQLAFAATPADTVIRTVARDGERLIIVSVAPITAEDDAERSARPRNAPIDFLILIDILTAEEVAAMGAALDLQGVVVIGAGAQAGSDHVTQPITAADGDVVGQLRWRHAHPGPASFSRLIWPVVIGLLCIGALAILIARLLVTHQVKVIARARDAHAASQAKSEFLTRVSHELRTPLNAIVGYAEMIQEENASLETRTDAGRIIVAARHLGQLINDIIDQSRVDSGRIKFHPEVLPVAGMLAEVQGLLQPAAEKAGVTLDATTSPLADFLYGDHVRLRQCLINLIGNAIKFSQRGARVTVKARLDRTSDRAMIVFDIADNGIGIDKSELGNIFRPFGQANAGIGKLYGGNGLGLSISRELARQMGGDISVVSAPGEGSTFSLSIPAATARTVRAA